MLHEFSGAGAPTTTPTAINMHYTDTNTGNVYFSKGTSSSADWVKMIVTESGVTSVFGRTGVIIAESGDYNAAQVGADPVGSASTVQTNLTTHINNNSNPHSTTKGQIGLGNVDNTSDLNKAISTATQTALDLKVDENAAITGATKTKITYDSKGLVTSGTDAALDDLSDVIIATPVVDDYLKYNGANWVNAQLNIPTSAGSGITYYLSNTASGISTYELMSKIPDSSSEVDETIVINNQQLNFENYISDVVLGGTQIDAGVWTFNIFAYASANVGDTKIIANVYKRTSGGTETLLFSVPTPHIDSTSVGLYTAETVQPAFSINTTDKLLFKFDAYTNYVGNVTVHLVHSGTANYTLVHTPLLQRHNDLASIQGGQSNEYYHLTNTEYTGSGTGVFVRQGSPTFTGTVSGLTKSMVGLGNVDNTSDANKPVSTAQGAADTAVQSFAIQRANHTGTQSTSTITNFATEVPAQVLTGIDLATAGDVLATDSILQAIGKLYANSLFWTELATTADLTNASNVTATNVTALSIPCVIGAVYRIEAMIVFRSTAVGTGIALSINTPNGAAGTIACTVRSLTANDGTAANFEGAVTTLGDFVIATNVPTANTDFIAEIKGIFRCTTAGTIHPVFRSETNGQTITLRIGSNILSRVF